METIKYKFVTSIPNVLEDYVLYISMEYGTAIHKCICGCGNEVVTPFSPTDWDINYDGESVSLNPSIGNWSFECQSHYWIIRNKIIHASKWSRYEIDCNRKVDKKNKKEFYSRKNFEDSEIEEKLTFLDDLSKSFPRWENFKKILKNLF